MRKVALAMLLCFGSIHAETIFASPNPSIEKPREIIMTLQSGDDKEIDHVLSTANNLLKFYGPERVRMRIVAYYHGIKAVLKKEKKIAVRIDALQQYGVEFVACGNTMVTKKIDKSELIDGVEIVTAGVAEVIERTKDGYINITL